MIQSERSKITQRITQLSAVLNASAAVLPIFVRFQKADKYLTLPVMRIEVTDATVIAVTENGTHHAIALASLLDIVAFCDKNGKPVFITEFSTGSEIAEDHRTGVEKENAWGLSLAIRHQHEYWRKRPTCPKRQPAASAQSECEHGNIEKDCDGLPMAA